MKRILFLGASRVQLAPIKYAVDMGHHVITCDYLPDNPGHQLAHESYNVSTTDSNTVLELARTLNIDGLIGYAVDSAAPTVAYVAEALGLPANPYSAVDTLVNKDKFRSFLARNGFNVPRSQAFCCPYEAHDWLKELRLPAFVKPVDSSGNKGVSRITDPIELKGAFEYALSYSRQKKVVVEEEIAKVGYQIDSDVFMVNGELRFWSWADAHFNPLCCPPFPMAQSQPTTLDGVIGEKAANETERMLKLLGCTTGPFNVEFMVDAEGEISFLDVGPRSGGDCDPERIRYATGVDLMKYAVDAALGLDCSSLARVAPNGCWANYVVHSVQCGVFESIWMSQSLRERVVSEQIWARPHEEVVCARGKHHGLGILMINFRSQEEMLGMLNEMHEHIKVRVS